jgi:hypothetical protein
MKYEYKFIYISKFASYNICCSVTNIKKVIIASKLW